MATTQSDVSGTSTTTSSKSYGQLDPVAAFNEFQKTSAPYVKVIEASTQAIQERSASAAAATETAGRQAATAVRAQGEIAAMERQKAVDIAAMMGSDLVAGEHARRVEAMGAKQKLLPQIEANMAVTPWEDPLKYVVNKFTTPTLIKAYNMANAAERDSTSRIDLIQRGIQQQKAIDLAPTQDALRKVAEAEALRMESDAIAKAEAIRIEAEGAVIRNAQIAVGMGQGKFNAYTETARMIAQANQTRAQEQITNNQLTLQDRELKKWQTEERDQEEILAKVNAHRALMAVAPLKMNEWRNYTPSVRSDMMVAAQTNGTIGEKLGETYAALVKNNAGANFQRVNPMAHQFISGIINGDEFDALKKKKITSADGAAFNKLPQEKQTELLLNELHDGWAKEYKQQPITSKLSEENPYRLNMARVSQYVELKDNYFSKTMLELQSRNPSYQYTEADIIAMAKGRARQALQDGNAQDIRKAAEELSEFFRMGMTAQYAYGGMHISGMARPDSYGVSVRGQYTDSKGVTRAVQMFDPVSVQQFLTQQAIREPFSSVGPDVANFLNKPVKSPMQVQAVQGAGALVDKLAGKIAGQP